MMRMSKHLTSRASNKGFFITFEGGEGAGKSTQITLLAEHLQAQGRDVVVTREPGGTAGAEVVRHVLLSGAAEKYGRAVETLLFAAARADHVDQLIAPALQAGKIVLCDRFIDSTRVYQAGERGEEKQQMLLELFEKTAILATMPDVTFILDLPAKIGLTRADGRRRLTEDQDRFEKESLDVHEQRRQAFLQIAAQEPHRCIVIDAAREVAVIAGDIATLTERRLR